MIGSPENLNFDIYLGKENTETALYFQNKILSKMYDTECPVNFFH